MNSLLKTRLLTILFGIGLVVASYPLSANNTFGDDADSDFENDHVTSFYLDDEDDGECEEEPEPWHHKYHHCELDLMEEDPAWELELETAWPGQREDFADTLIR